MIQLYIHILILIGVALPSYAELSQNGASSSSVMVLYVSAVRVNVDRGEIYSKILTNTIRTELGKSNKYKLANPETDKAVEQAKNYNEACLSLEECARKEAKSVDADLVLISEVTQIEQQCRVSLRLENIYTKEIIKSKNLRASCAVDDLEEKIIELVYMIMRNEKQQVNGQREARITSDPAGAKVSVNNQFIGRTPVNSKIPVGQVTFRLEFDGKSRYAPIVVNELVDDSPQLFIYNKVFAERNAYVIFEISPSTAKVIMDEKLIDIVGASKVPVEIGKNIKLEFSADKYETAKITVPQLQPDQEYKLNLALKPLPCNFSVSSNPSEAAVLKDGVQVGSTPFQQEIMPGDHEYSIQLKSYYAQTIKFYCSPGQIVQRAPLLKRTKFTDEEQARIDSSATWRTSSYYTAALAFVLGGGAYLSYSQYKKYDEQYLASTNPIDITSYREKRDGAKSLTGTLAIGSAVTFGAAYIFYNFGEFPSDLNQKTSFNLISSPTETRLAWLYKW